MSWTKGDLTLGRHFSIQPPQRQYLRGPILRRHVPEPRGAQTSALVIPCQERLPDDLFRRSKQPRLLSVGFNALADRSYRRLFLGTWTRLGSAWSGLVQGRLYTQRNGENLAASLTWEWSPRTNMQHATLRSRGQLQVHNHVPLHADQNGLTPRNRCILMDTAQPPVCMLGRPRPPEPSGFMSRPADNRHEKWHLVEAAISCMLEDCRSDHVHLASRVPIDRAVTCFSARPSFNSKVESWHMLQPPVSTSVSSRISAASELATPGLAFQHSAGLPRHTKSGLAW